MKKVLILAGGLIFMMAACSKDQGTPVPATPPIITSGTTTYTGDVKPIMTSKCAISGCHAANQNFPDLTNYNSVKANVDDILFRMGLNPANGSFMPQGGAKVQSDIDIITNWKADGLLQ